ncbi:hypothetical protein [Methylobacterium sp. WSM2598]|uniref:hypothetical protein n=1 Tax=Methylobacterium sp. WSM2598 TaxID=398261 RepID=UPI00035E85E9|nr:hypothetical protein [Methylobacterium sp. WSM2598]
MPSRGYALRKGRQGWDIYAEHTGKPVLLNGREQTGLSRRVAVQLVTLLKRLALAGADVTDLPVKGRYTIH